MKLISPTLICLIQKGLSKHYPKCAGFVGEIQREFEKKSGHSSDSPANLNGSFSQQTSSKKTARPLAQSMPLLNLPNANSSPNERARPSLHSNNSDVFYDAQTNQVKITVTDWFRKFLLNGLGIRKFLFNIEMKLCWFGSLRSQMQKKTCFIRIDAIKISILETNLSHFLLSRGRPESKHF